MKELIKTNVGVSCYMKEMKEFEETKAREGGGSGQIDGDDDDHEEGEIDE